MSRMHGTGSKEQNRRLLAVWRRPSRSNAAAKRADAGQVADGGAACAPAYFALSTQKVAVTSLRPSFRQTQRRSGNDPRRLLRITDTKLDLDKPVRPNAGAHCQRHARVDDLEMRHLDPLPTARDFPPGCQRGGADLGSERCTSLGSWNDNNGC
jgi:hypothetical protein